MKQKDQSDCFRAFHWSTKAWYSKSHPCNEIKFGMYAHEGGWSLTTGEMTMRWHNLGGDRFVARLEVFEDSWYDLNQFRDVIEKLAEVDGDKITEQQFVDILLACGFKDITAYADPDGRKE